MSHRSLRAQRLPSGFALILCLLFADPVLAQQPTAGATNHQAEIDAAWQAADKVATTGPAKVPLLDQADLALPANEAFVPAAEAGRILRAYGNQTDDHLVGLVTGTRDVDHWLVVVEFFKDGYIKDDDARDWHADEVLAGIREGTAADNQDRKARGFSEMEVLGWIEPPTYDPQAHRLVWSISAKDRNAPADRPHTVNYNTYALGRDGYFSLDLLTDSATVESLKPVARNLLAALAYRPGRRYEDFDKSADKVAAYGLAALVGVVAVKKLGLLAALGVFALKAWKLAVVAFLAAGAAIRRFFKRDASGTK